MQGPGDDEPDVGRRELLRCSIAATLLGPAGFLWAQPGPVALGGDAIFGDGFEPDTRPTHASLWSDADATIGATTYPQIALQAPADVTYTVTWRRGGVAVATSTIPPGNVGAIAPVPYPAVGTSQLDFDITPALTRLRRPIPVTVFDGSPRIVTEFADVATAGHWDIFYLENRGLAPATFSILGSGVATTFSPSSGTIPPGAKIPIGFKAQAPGSCTITVASTSLVQGPTKTLTVRAAAPPNVPPAASVAYERIHKAVPTGNWLCFERWFVSSDSAAYDRWCRPLLVSATHNRVQFFKYVHEVGRAAFGVGESYQLVMWERPAAFAGQIALSSLGPGTVIATRTVTTGGTALQEFVVNLSGMSEGWKLVDIIGPPGFVGLPFWMYVMPGAVPVDQNSLPWLPTATHVFDSHFDGSQTVGFDLDDGKWGPPGTYNHHLHRIPNRVQGLAVPLARRETPHFQDFPATRTQFVCTALTGSLGWPVEVRTVVESVPSSELPMGAGGRLRHTFNEQYYYKSKFFRANPLYPTNDGPRGVNHVWAPTVLDFGVALPGNTGYRGNLYFCESHRFGKIDRSGTVTTLAGYRHKHPPTRAFEDTAASIALQDYDLVGDWSAVPEERRGFHELWALAWDERTLPINTDVAPIASEDNQQPHVLPVVAFLADTQNNRICKLEFVDSAATSSNPRHGGRVRVTEFITGLSDPWGMVYDDGKLYITERLGHRITVWSADTPQTPLGTLVSGAALSGVDTSRQPFRLAPLATIQAQPIVGPEGLVKFIDEAGVKWLIFAGWAMDQIRRIPIAGGTVSVCVPTLMLDGNSLWVHLAISDGSFGARGTLVHNTWSAANASGSAPFPEAWKYDGALSWSRWQYYAGNDFDEPGLPWPSGEQGYPTAAGIGNGMLAFGGASQGIRILSRRLPSDAVIGNYRAGRAKWVRLGYAESHGPGGFSKCGLAVPWGEPGVDADVEAYLRAHGHVRP